MNIGEPLRKLGVIDADPLREAILAQEDAAWRESEYRQRTYEHHEQTQTIVLVFTDGANWPNCEVRKGPGWERLGEAAVPVMREIVKKHYPTGGEVIRAMAAKLPPGGRIKTHCDVHESFHCGHRIHVPIATNPRVWWTIDGRPYQFEVGQAYELNNQKQHSVANRGTEDRITFIFDYVPPGPLAHAPGQSRRRPSSRPGVR